MKNKKRSRILWIAGAILLFVGIIVALGHINCRGPRVVAPISETFTWLNQAGKQVLSQKGYAAQYQLREKRIADSLAELYGFKIKNLQEYIIAMTETKADIPPVPGSQERDYAPVDKEEVYYPPLLANIRESFHSPYYDAQVQIGDSSYMHLQKKDTITVLWKVVREGKLFNRRKLLQLDVSLADTSTRLTGLKSFRAGPLKPKRTGIGLQLGYEFDGKRFRPYFGLGVSYNLIRL